MKEKKLEEISGRKKTLYHRVASTHQPITSLSYHITPNHRPTSSYHDQNTSLKC
jgi:hypothetical protein